MQDFFNLHRIIRHQFRCGIHCCQTAADNARRQPHLQVGHRRGLGRASQLQGHQKVRGLADAAHQVVFNINNGRLARAGCDTNMIETHVPGIVYGNRTAETYAAVGPKSLPSLQGQVDDFQEVFVPAHGDAVFGHAAETCQDAFVQIFV